MRKIMGVGINSQKMTQFINELRIKGGYYGTFKGYIY